MDAVFTFARRRVGPRWCDYFDFSWASSTEAVRGREGEWFGKFWDLESAPGRVYGGP
jgi:hypothetical protein